jgi:hypothetical protein
MTMVYGVTRHDDNGNPIACHADERQKAQAPAPSNVTGQASPEIQALANAAQTEAIASTMKEILSTDILQTVQVDPNWKPDGRSKQVKDLMKATGLTLEQIREQIPSGKLVF